VGDDIVERLRYEAWRNPSEGETADAHYLAADALAEIERLRAAGDELVASLTPVSFAGPHEDMNRLERAYLAWQETRRG
jgi:hypothetical protein